MRATDQLPPKLEAVLIRIGKAAPLNMTRAVKLPYLVDVVANHVLGHPITEGTHQAWEYGVVTAEAWRYLDTCRDYDSPVFHLEPVQWSEEKRVVVTAEEPADGLTPEEQAIVDFVVHEYALLNAGALGRLTKLMNPEISNWGSNRAADAGPDAVERLSSDYQEMAERVSHVTLDQLRRDSTPLGDTEEAIA